MPISTESLIVIAVIISGFIVGRILKAKYFLHLKSIRNATITIALRFCIPLSLLLAIWVLPNLRINLLWLSLLGLGILLAGFAIGFLLSKVYGFSAEQRAVFAPAGAYTNIGAVGALVITVFIGEAGLALLPIFKLFEEILYYGFLFPYAASHSKKTSQLKTSPWKDPIILTMLSAVFIGLLLNIFGVKRPDILNGLPLVLVPTGTFSLMISVGLIFQLQTVVRYWKPALVLAVSKQVLLPILFFGLFFAATGFITTDILIIKVFLIIACMPMAFVVILPANLYELDQALANACWFLSMLVFIATVPFYRAALDLVARLIG